MIRSRHNTYVSVTDWFKNKSESVSSQQLKPAIIQYLNNIGGENIVLPPTTDSPTIVPPSSGGGSTETNCLWELKQDSYGNSYIYGNLPVVTQYGITMYADVSNIDLPGLYDGLPIDNSTIYWEETLDDTGNIIKVLKAKGGEGIDINGTLDDYLFDYLTDNNYAQKSDLPNMSLYVTNDVFSSTINGLDFVDFNTYETINAIKNFKEGIEINGLGIYNIKDDIIYINGNVAIKGGLTVYTDDGNIDLPSLYAGIPVDGTTITKREDGTLMLNPNLELGGLDEEALRKYLDDYNYAKITDIDSRINDLVNGAPAAYDTLKEIADVLQGNVNSIGDIITTLGTKADKTELDKYLPLKGGTMSGDITLPNKKYIRTESNSYAILGMDGSKYVLAAPNYPTTIRSNGALKHNSNTIWDSGNLPIIYDAEEGYWKLTGNLLITGGITQYVDDGSVDLPNLYDGLPIDNQTIYWEETANGKVLKAQGGGGGITSITSQMVVEALGYTPYDARNPNGYITSDALSGYLPKTGGTIDSGTNWSELYVKSTNASLAFISFGDWGYVQSNQLSLTGVGGASGYVVSFLFDNIRVGTEGYDVYHSGMIPTIKTHLGLATVATSGSYTDLSNKPTIPTNTNQLTNGAGFITIGSTVKAGATETTDTLANWCKANQSYVGSIALSGTWYNLISVRHRNGASDGNLYGMSLYSSLTGNDNLIWRQHINNAWGTAKVLLDSSNYSSYALPLSGGTLTKTSDTAILALNNTATSFAYMAFRHNGNDRGYLACNNGELKWAPVNNSAIAGNGSFHVVWHDGNDGSGSGLDADLLDGVQLSGLFTELNTTDDTNLSITIGGIQKTLKNLNAHRTDFFTSKWSYDSGTEFDLNTWISGGMVRCYGNSNLLLNKPSGFTYGNVLCLSEGTKALTGQLAWAVNSGSTTDTTKAMWFRVPDSSNGYTYAKWHQIAFTDSNVASATKLQTARTIWGQSFDGTGNVNGKLMLTSWDSNGVAIRLENSSAGNALISTYSYPSNAYDFGQKSNRFIINHNTYGEVFSIANGNVGIGTISPFSKFHVAGAATIGLEASTTPYSSINFRNTDTDLWQISARFNKNASANNNVMNFYYNNGSTWKVTMALYTTGNLLVAGGITQYSQRSLKNIVDERGLSLKELSVIKPTRYTWKDNRDTNIHIGGIADDIMTVLPEVVIKNGEGVLTMDYGNAGFAIASSLIKPVIDHEERIRRLEKENMRLKKEIKRLKAAQL